MAEYHRLEQLIEGYRVSPILNQETVLRIGDLILRGEGEHFINDRLVPQLDDGQLAVAQVAALGATTRQAGEQLGIEESIVIETREELLAIYAVPAMSAVINKIIRNGTLSVEVQPKDPHKRLPKKMDMVLDAFMVGIPGPLIARALGEGNSAFGRTTHLLVRKRLDANGRTHSVYEAYRQGLRHIPERRAA
jgi:hypothetical protein